MVNREEKIMKKFLCLALAIILCLSVTACGGGKKNKYDPSQGNILITDDMVSEIREAVLKTGKYGALSYSFEADALRAANARIGVSSGYEDIKEFTSIQITSEDFHDDWHYRFYGTIFGKNIYNKNVAYDFSITIVCAENSATANGYKIQRDGISININ